MIHLHKNEALKPEKLNKFFMFRRGLSLLIFAIVAILLKFIYSKSNNEALDFLGKSSCSSDEFLNSIFSTIDNFLDRTWPKLMWNLGFLIPAFLVCAGSLIENFLASKKKEEVKTEAIN